MNSITIIRTSAPPTPPAVTVLRVAGFSVQESILLPSVYTKTNNNYSYKLILPSRMLEVGVGNGLQGGGVLKIVVVVLAIILLPTGDISGNSGMSGNGRVWYKCSEAVCHCALKMSGVEVRND